ncbi:MAG: hypothetical protein LBI78_05885, partial [Campylobacteraceae bacterium]|nr:hypothetical protein [Campylobacteraceae bacterium]
RNTDNIVKELYSGNTGVNVEASLDHRFLSEEGRDSIKEDFVELADTLDNVNRYVKDKIGGYELTDELKNKIEQNGIENSLIEALKEQGVSEEKINEVLANEKVQTLLLGYQDTQSNNENTNSYIDSEGNVVLNTIEVTPSKDLQEYIVDGAEGIKAIVDIVGEDKAAAGILVAQFVLQGTVRTVTSLAGDEVKDFFFGGLKEITSDYLATSYFDINDEYWNTNQQSAIKSITDVTADFGVDAILSGGVFAIIKKANTLSKVNDTNSQVLRVSEGDGIVKRPTPVESEKHVGEQTTTKAQTLEVNKAAGAAFEQKTMEELKGVQSGVVQQVTVKTDSGVKTRIDLVGRDAQGNIICTECKASSTAPLTNNQKAAFPEIMQSGATVVGKGKEGFEGGTKIPPTNIDIVRPKVEN